MVVGLRPTTRRPAAIVAAVLAAQLAGHGTVAIRDLLPWGSGLAGAAWLGDRARRAAAGTVIASAAAGLLSTAATFAERR